MVEKFFGENGNVKDADLVAGAIWTVASADIISVTVLWVLLLRMPLLLLLTRLHVLDNMQLRVVGLDLLDVWLLSLAVRCMGSRLLL